MTGGGTITKAICYSLPRLIAKPISAVFSAYFGDLYIHTFEWRPEDFGLVTSTYSFFRSVSYFLLGLVYYAIIKDNDQDQNGKNLTTSKIIVLVSIALHALSFISLIFLPIRWYAVKTPILSFLARVFMKLCNITYIPFNILWNLLCRARTTGRRYLTPYERYEELPKTLSKFHSVVTSPLPHNIPNPHINLEPKHPPQPILCFNTPRFNDILLFIKSKLFIIILFAIIHGIGLSSYELSNRAIPLYIEKDDNNLKTLTSTNLGMYSTAYLLTITTISLIKYYLSHVISDSELFFIIAILFNIFQVIILPLFYSFTNSDNSSSTPEQTECTCRCTSEEQATTCTCPCCKSKCDTAKNPQLKDWCQLFSMIILHGSINFWLSTPGPVAQYVATYIHDGNNTLKTFGPFVLLGFETLTTILYAIFNYLFGDKGKKCKCCCNASDRSCTSNPKCNCCCKDSTKKCCCNNDSEDSTTDKFITGLSIAGQVFIYLLFYRFDYWWNKGNWLNFALFAVCGVIYGLFLLYISNMHNAVIKKECFKKYKWIIIGSMLFCMYFSTSLSLYVLYKVYDREKLLKLDYAIIRRILDCTFPGAYVGMTILLQALNIISAVVYFCT